MIPHSLKLSLLQMAHKIWYLFRVLTSFITETYYNILSYVEHANKTSLCIPRSSFSNLKIPKHIAMSFTNETDHLDLESIARLLCWCKQLRIDYITLYDHLGKLKDKQTELIKHVEHSIGSLGCEKPLSHIAGLRIISGSDWRQKFLEEVKDLVKLEPEKIDIYRVNNRIGWSTDPEMLINFGHPLCLHGFPPWQLRLTEILAIPTHRKLPQKVFLECLRRYSRTTQRGGI